MWNGAHSEERGPRESENKAEAAQSDNQHSSTPKQITVPANSSGPTVININTGNHAGEERHCTQPKNWKEWGSFAWCRSLEWMDAERVIAAFTVILAIATGILGIATWRLWRSTDRLVKSAEATAERQLRAYVFAIQGRVRRFAVGEPVEIVVTIKNTGQTPAYEFRHSMSVAMTENPPRETFPGVDWSKPHVSALGPGRVVTHFGGFPGCMLSESHMASIKCGKTAIWAYGEIKYKDAFGTDRATRFKFGFEGNVVTDPSGGMYSAADGNEAD